jgi:transposase
MVGVEQWAEIRRLYYVKRLPIKEIARRSGLSRNTVRKALRSGEPPRYRRPPRTSKLDPFRDEIGRLLRADPRLPGQRIRELIAEQGYSGGKTILDDYLRELRPLYLPRPRTFQRTSYRPGALCQFDLWEPSGEIPVGHGQSRRGYVVVGCLPYSRIGAGTLVFSKQAPDLLHGIGRCLQLLGGLPQTLVWDREGALHGGQGRPSAVFAAFLGQLALGWQILESHDPQSKGVVERANVRFHRTLRCRPADRLVEELEAMRPLPDHMPDVDRRFVTRVPPDPYLRVDTNDYSLDPNLVGRRLQVRVSQRQVLAVALETGELACSHPRSFARHRTITALAHARALRSLRGAPAEPEVELRPLERYDALIPA